MGVERAREETGLSFCFCQQHIGEKNKTGEGGERVAGSVSAEGVGLWQAETEWCKKGSEKGKRDVSLGGKRSGPKLCCALTCPGR